MIFGINTTSDFSKLFYVISRAVRRVKFETSFLKYHEWYLREMSRTNHATICLYYYPQTVCNFHISQSNCSSLSCSSINPSIPPVTYKLSTLVSKHFRNKLVERIYFKIKAFSLRWSLLSWQNEHLILQRQSWTLEQCALGLWMGRIERNSGYVTLPWYQNFCISTNCGPANMAEKRKKKKRHVWLPRAWLHSGSK